MGNVRYSDYNRGRLEMAIDCEGCLSLNKAKINWGKRFQWLPRLVIDNTNKKLLETLKEISGGLGNVGPMRGATGNWKATYYWQLHANALRVILPQLKLVIKEEQRILLLEALQLIEENRYHSICSYENEVRLEQIYEDMENLNHRGVNDSHSTTHFNILEVKT